MLYINVLLRAPSRRPALLVAIACLCLIALAAPALAAAPEVPETLKPTEVKATSTLLHGLLNPGKVGEPGTFETLAYEFVYRQASACRGAGEVKTTQGMSLGAGQEEVGQALEALTAGKEYTVCLLARPFGKALGEEEAESAPVHFTTATPPQTPETKPATSVTATTATLNAIMNPAAKAAIPVEYDFTYERSATECEPEGTLAPAEPAAVTGKPKEAVSTSLTGLEPNSTYTFCAFARNSAEAGETAVGNVVHFTTPAAPPAIVEEKASNVKATEATLEGIVNPNNQFTECHFQYGFTSVSENTVACSPELMKGFGEQGVSFTATFLEPGKTYKYRIVAKNASGEESVGPEREFKRLAAPPEAPTTEEPQEVTNTTATLHGLVNPASSSSLRWFFQYAAGSSCKAGAAVKSTPAQGPEEVQAHPAEAAITGLLRASMYTVCLIAENEAGEKTYGNEVSFTTAAVVPAIESEFSTEVSSTAASLHATINPDGAATSYYFQYATASTAGCTPSTCQSTPAEPGEPLGSGNHEAVEQHLQGLTPGTTYHYRAVLVSQIEGHPQTIPGLDHTFVTRATANATTGPTLPDGRQWELVTPPDKHGATPLGIAGTATQASLSGDAFTLVVSNPTEEAPAGYHFDEQLLATRGATGWTSEDINPPRATPTGPGSHPDYQLFSEDLSLALEAPAGEFTSLQPDVFPLDTENTPYLRYDLTCQAKPMPPTCYEPLVTSAPGYADVPEGTKFGGVGGAQAHGVQFAGASPDLAHVVMQSEAPLTKGATRFGMYEWSADEPLGESELQPVDVLPAAEGGGMVGAALGQPNGSRAQVNARWAISGDGTRVVWTVAQQGLYLRDMTDQQSVRLDVPEAACLKAGECGAGEVAPEFQIANEEGSRVFFTDSQQLLAGAGPGDLYECEVVVEAAGPTCVLHDLAPGAGVVGDVLGASEDGSYVYFVSNSVVGDGAAHGATPGNCTAIPGEGEKAGQSCDLYMLHYDGAGRAWEAPVFIGELSGLDGPDWRPEMVDQGARVSPNGRWLTFTSARPLTGYDNHDAHSGQPDEEVFLFDAAHGQLVCVSCNPTGARPVGYEQGRQPRLASGDSTWGEASWLAASLPERTSSDVEMSRYQSRYLDDEGRLFFNSHDALVPRDVNGNEDVYEFEPAGVGGESGCQESTPSFHQAMGGCVSMLSSGASADESAFLDASETGNDLFFLTSEQLVKEDADTAFDVYDAHACSSASPCFSAPESPLPCTTADACRAASPPQPGAFGAPPSATFSGPGNLAPLAGPKPKTAAQIRAERLAKALKLCHRDKNKKKRTACERAAHSKYGASKAKKSTNRKGSH